MFQISMLKTSLVTTWGKLEVKGKWYVDVIKWKHLIRGPPCKLPTIHHRPLVACLLYLRSVFCFLNSVHPLVPSLETLLRQLCFQLGKAATVNRIAVSSLCVHCMCGGCACRGQRTACGNQLSPSFLHVRSEDWTWALRHFVHRAISPAWQFCLQGDSHSCSLNWGLWKLGNSGWILREFLQPRLGIWNSLPWMGISAAKWIDCSKDYHWRVRIGFFF